MCHINCIFRIVNPSRLSNRRHMWFESISSYIRTKRYICTHFCGLIIHSIVPNRNRLFLNKPLGFTGHLVQPYVRRSVIPSYIVLHILQRMLLRDPNFDLYEIKQSKHICATIKILNRLYLNSATGFITILSQLMSVGLSFAVYNFTYATTNAFKQSKLWFLQIRRKYTHAVTGWPRSYRKSVL